MTTHTLKILPQYFEPVLDGSKTFEIRLDDRGFQKGDAIMLRETDDFGTKHTGRTIIAVIGYVSTYEQKPGFVVFSLLDVKETTR